MNIVEKLREKGAWIFGIGKTGQKLVLLFQFARIDIRGILVSDTRRNPEQFAGIRVGTVNESDIRMEDIIVIACYDENNKIYNFLKRKRLENVWTWDADNLRKFWQDNPHVFEDRRRDNKKVLFVLSGYKRFLWKEVFYRLKKYINDEIDICICSSGIYVEELSVIAEENGWSYLSTHLNSVTYIQNIAYAIYASYEWIYKMDEDIFLTENALSLLHSGYIDMERNSPYHIGISAPLIPLNEFGYRIILEKYGLVDEFKKKFQNPRFGGYEGIVSSPQIAEFMWGIDGKLPSIDEMMKRESDKRDEFLVCGSRFNIGLILFRRKMWEEMNGFCCTGGVDLGIDEEEICAWCMNSSRVIAVLPYVIVGHFSFARQEKNMMRWLDEITSFGK